MKTSIYHFLFFATLVIYYLPFFIAGENSPIDVFDNMDSNIVWTKLALENFDQIFNPDAKIEQLMGGLPFGSVYPNLDIATFIFYCFGMFWGFIVNKIIMSLVAYFGLFLLLNNTLKINNKILIFLLSSLFAFYPFWSFSLHIAGIPLLFFCFFQLLNNKSNSIFLWIYPLIYVLYSSLILIGVFVLLFMTVVVLRKLWLTKKIDLKALSLIFAMSILYLLSHFPIINSFFLSENQISHRVEMKTTSFSLKELIRYIGAVFIRGDFVYHGNKPYIHIFYILPVFAFIIYSIRTKINQNLTYFKNFKWISYYFIISFLVLIFTVWKPSHQLYEAIYKIVPLTLERLLWFQPIAWLLIFSIVADYFISKKERLKWFFFLIIGLQSYFVFKHHSFIVNKNKPSFSEFYSEKQFEKVKHSIAEDQSSYKVLCVGFHPGIAQFNNFQTVGGFSVSYPLAYKHEFYKIIEKELEKNPNINSFFIEWGSWCYAFSSEYGMRFTNNSITKINNLELDLNQAKEMGANYVISTAKINLSSIPKLKLKQHVESTEDYYNLYVYEIQ